MMSDEPQLPTPTQSNEESSPPTISHKEHLLIAFENICNY